MVSVLHLRFVDKIGMLCPFKPTQHQLYGYGGKSLKVKGKVRQTCTYNASAKDLEFYVVDTTEPLVLSLQSYLDLKLINLELSVDLLPDPIQKLPKTLSYILKENADVFTDIGLVCGEYQITLSPEVNPTELATVNNLPKLVPGLAETTAPPRHLLKKVCLKK